MRSNARNNKGWVARAALPAVLILAATAACGDDGDDTTSSPESTAEASADPGSEAAAESTFSDGQVVRVILGSSPGGGFDTQARLLQPYLDEALDEAAGVDVDVVVENKPGADHRIATEEVNNSSDPTMIFSSLQLMTTNDVVKGADYDLAAMTPLASAGRSARGFAASDETADEGATAEDVLRQPEALLFAHPGLDADVALMRAILAENGLEANFSPIRLGQTAEIMTSLLRGEAQIATSTLAGMAPFVEDSPNEIRMVAALSCERDESMPDVETIVEQGLPGAEELCTTVGYDDRVFFGPPELGEGDAQVLQEALEAALTNSEYQSAAKEAGLVADYVDPDELQEITQKMVDTYNQYDLDLPAS